MKKILLIGGAGYIGRVLIEDFLKKKFQVICFDNLIYGQKIYFKNKNFKFIKGDISKKKSLKTLIKQKFDATVILAGLVGDPITKKYKKISKRINDEGVLNVIEYLKKYKFSQKNIFISTCSNYGLSKNRIVDEKSKLKPLSLYAKSKVNIEKKLLSKEYKNLNSTILRFSTAFGQSERMRYDLTVNQFILEMIKDNLIKVYDPDTWRPYCHVKDFSRAIHKVIISPQVLTANQVYNVGDDKNNFSKRKMAEIVKSFTGGEVQYLSISKDKRDYRVSFKKLNKILKFKCKYNLDYGIKEMIANLKHKNNKKLKSLLTLGNFKIKYK
jgi:nucleoside-diphosphate-sugar epimerase